VRQIAGKKLLVIWDGSPIHRSKLGRKTISGRGGAAEHNGCKTRTELPGLRSGAQPRRGDLLEKHLKHVELKNVCWRSLWELRRELRKAKERLRHKKKKKHVIFGCIRQPGFEV